MSMRIQLKGGDNLTLISVYTPTMQRPQEEKEQFDEMLGSCVSAAEMDSVIILGDLNARVGLDWKSWPNVIGKHGVGKMNSNGLILLEFCTRFQLSIMGRRFQLKDSLKNTWQHLRSKHWHQLDHVLSNKAAKSYVSLTKVNRAANCFNDHKLLISKCLFSIKNKKRGTRPPKKLDTRLDDDKKVLLEQFLDERLSTCNTDVDELTVVLQNAAAHVFGKKKRVQNDWFDDQDDAIQKLLQDKNMDRHVLRRRIRELKNNWFRHRAEEAERYFQEKNQRDFNATLNAVYSPRSRTSHPVKSKDGELLTAPDMIKDRWVEHFSDLLNQPTDADLTIADGIDQLPVIESMSRPIEEQELDQALRNTRLGKSPGPDGILPGILVNGGRRLRAFLLVLFNICWVTEIIPLDWIDANIAVLFKKGDRSHCGNYRGISLLSAVGKVLADIILQRLHLLVESMYPQSQSGYRNGRSTID